MVRYRLSVAATCRAELFVNTTTIALPIGTKICPSSPPSASLFTLWNYHDAYAVDVPLQSPHGDGGTNVAFADGSVRYLPTGTDFGLRSDLAAGIHVFRAGTPASKPAAAFRGVWHGGRQIANHTRDGHDEGRFGEIDMSWADARR
jgi:prepilin-type processing-associated H-X9-DG protein